MSRAKACLEELPDTEYRRALLAVPDFILERTELSFRVCPPKTPSSDL